MCQGVPLAFYVNYLYNNIAKSRVISAMEITVDLSGKTKTEVMKELAQDQKMEKQSSNPHLSDCKPSIPPTKLPANWPRAGGWEPSVTDGWAPGCPEGGLPLSHSLGTLYASSALAVPS